MLSAEDNELLTRVEGDAPMGALLRRYWYPVAAVDQLRQRPTRRVRIFGEDLALYRDRSGRYGLLAEQCPHRGASLAWGIPEPDGLRCMYHGWLFDGQGRCVEQPNEPPNSRYCERITTPAYPVQELGGLLFGYFGPPPAPVLPRWDVLTWSPAGGQRVVKQIGAAVLPCNWLQVMENSVDPYHTEWLHGKYGAYVAESQGRLEESQAIDRLLGQRHVEVGFDRFEYGILKRRIRDGQTKDDDSWRIGHPLVIPNMLKVGGHGRYELQYRVPVDDTHTWHVWYQASVVPEGQEVPEQDPVPYYDMPLFDEHGDYLVGSINVQDVMAWVTQGPIAQRTREHLGTTDRGIVLLRRMLKEELVKAQAGQDPLGVVREEHDVIDLPMEGSIRSDLPIDVEKVALRGWRSANTPDVDKVLDATRG